MQKRNLRFTLKLSIAAALTCYSSQLACAEELKDRAQELNALETLRHNDPELYAHFYKLLTFTAQTDLAKLGYTTRPFDGVLDEKTQNAIRSYQRYSGLPVTGDFLSDGTIRKLRSDSDLLDNPPIRLPDFLLSTALWDSGYVSATGTWEISGEKQAWPIQTSSIECIRSIENCREATAILDSGVILRLETEHYQIERWDQNEIVTKPLQYECVRYIIRINRVQNSVTGIRSTAASTPSCALTEKTEKYLVLRSGYEMSQARDKAYNESVNQLLDIPPEMRASLSGSSK